MPSQREERGERRRGEETQETGGVKWRAGTHSFTNNTDDHSVSGV